MSEHEEKTKKPIYKKWWFWAIIVIIIIAIAGSSGNKTNTTVVSQTDTTSENKNQETTEKKVNVGEAVQTNEVKISYKSSKEYTGYNSYSKPKSGNKVIKVEFEFENISNGDIYLENMDCYADGEKCEEYYYADDYKSPTLESISKGKKVKSILYYEVPKSAEDIIIEYETDYWTNEKVEFIVK